MPDDEYSNIPRRRPPGEDTLREMLAQKVAEREESEGGVQVVATSAQMEQLLQQFAVLASKITDHQPLPPRVDTGSFEEAPGSASRAWKAIKWSFGILVGGAAAIFALGSGYQKAIGDNATKSDIEAHSIKDLVPVKEEVEALKIEMLPVKSGVRTLVTDRNAERAYTKAKRKLDKYDKQHEEAMQDYTADKAAGKRAERPKKDEPHLDLEDLVEELEKKL